MSRITGRQIKDNTITGEDVDESSLVINLQMVTDNGSETTNDLLLSSVNPRSDLTYSLGTNSKRWNQVHTNDLTVYNNLVLNGSDISFSDNNNSYPTDSGGFFWDLNNDEARIYAVQPGSDQISFIFKLSDNSNTSNDRFVFWHEDYRSNSGNSYAYDKFPLVFYGDQIYLCSPSSRTTEGVPDIGESGFRFTHSGLFAIKVRGGDPSTLTDYAHIYAKNVNSKAELFVRDENGNVTQISPHNEENEWEYFSRNTKTGRVVRINMEKMIRKLEEITGENFMDEWYE